MKTEANTMTEAEAYEIFKAIAQLEANLKAGDLNPVDELLDYLDQIDHQIEISQTAHAEGFASGMAQKASAKRGFFNRTAAPQEPSTTPTDQNIQIDPALLDKIPQEMWKSFIEAYTKGYIIGYAKEEPSIGAKFSKMTQEVFERILEKNKTAEGPDSTTGTIDPARRAVLQDGLLDPASIKALPIPTILGPLVISIPAIEEAITFYARASEEVRDQLRAYMDVDEPQSENDAGSETESEHEAETPEPIAPVDPNESAKLHQAPQARSNTMVRPPAAETATIAPTPSKVGQPATATPVATTAPVLFTPQNSSGRTSSKPSHRAKPPARFNASVRGIFSRNIKDVYLSKKKNLAQTAFSYDIKRNKQINDIDDIRDYLDKNKNIDPKTKAIILYAVMKNIHENLKQEFRWTRIFGSKSRLEAILEKDMAAIRKNFPGAELPGADLLDKKTTDLLNKKATDLIGTLGDQELSQKCSSILQPEPSAIRPRGQ